MNLRELRLKSWRSYADARFAFSEPTPRRNIVLIGAQNGGGKTSLFEGIVLGIFGRQGLSLLPPPKTEVGASNAPEATLFGRGQQNYDRLMEGILNRDALREQRMTCSVEMVFSEGEHRIFRLQRQWHFRAGSGAHKSADEELRLFVGPENKPLLPPALAEESDEWQREEIAARLLPSYLAKFFLFDAEQVRVYAEQGMESQVRRGIEGLLGLPVLKSLEKSLRTYADQRRSTVVSNAGGSTDAVRLKVTELDEACERVEAEIEEYETRLPPLKAERDQLTRRVGEGAKNQADLQQSVQNEDRYRSAAAKELSDLQDILTGDLALALTGADLRAATVAALKAEGRRADWIAGRTQIDASLVQFVEVFRKRLGALNPPLRDGADEELAHLASEVWAELRNPPPADIDVPPIHAALSAEDRARAIDRLGAVANGPAARSASVVEAYLGYRQEAERASRTRIELEGQGTASAADIARLPEVSEEIGRIETLLRNAQVLLRIQTTDRDEQRRILARAAERETRGKHPKQQADLALKVAEVTKAVLAEAVPTQVASVAAAMTEAYKKMARKTGLVDRIEITPEGSVRLLDSRNEDIRAQRLSAGEEQIFTQALIWAIAKVSKRDFPFVVDTPLGRLDTAHVEAVLRDFTDRTGQVFLLSTDREVIGTNLEAIRDRILDSYVIETRIINGSALSVPRRGYFGDGANT